MSRCELTEWCERVNARRHWGVETGRVRLEWTGVNECELTPWRALVKARPDKGINFTQVWKQDGLHLEWTGCEHVFFWCERVWILTPWCVLVEARPDSGIELHTKETVSSNAWNITQISVTGLPYVTLVAAHRQTCRMVWKRAHWCEWWTELESRFWCAGECVFLRNVQFSVQYSCPTWQDWDLFFHTRTHS